MQFEIDDESLLLEGETLPRHPSIVASEVTGVPSALLVYCDVDKVVLAPIDWRGRTVIASGQHYFTCILPKAACSKGNSLSSGIVEATDLEASSRMVDVDGHKLSSNLVTSSLHLWSPDANPILTYREGDKQVIAAIRSDGRSVMLSNREYTHKSVRPQMRQQRRESVLRATHKKKVNVTSSYRKLVKRAFAESAENEKPQNLIQRLSKFWRSLSAEERLKSSKKLLRRYNAEWR